MMKFGGSSVADAPRLANVAGLVRAAHEEGRGTLVVLSALGGATDALIKAGKSAGPWAREEAESPGA